MPERTYLPATPGGGGVRKGLCFPGRAVEVLLMPGLFPG